jgi:hypothetical protein
MAAVAFFIIDIVLFVLLFVIVGNTDGLGAA